MTRRSPNLSDSNLSRQREVPEERLPGQFPAYQADQAWYRTLFLL